MNRTLGTIILSLTFFMCSSPKVEFDDKNKADERSVDFLNKLDAVDSSYSVLIFTNGFLENQRFEGKNNDNIIFNEILHTDRVLGFANAIRIKNNLDVVITNKSTNYTFVLPTKRSVRYKYIYISKIVEEDKSYFISYSNGLQSFY